jgi:isoamylase
MTAVIKPLQYLFIYLFLFSIHLLSHPCKAVSLGGHYDSTGAVTFAVYSSRATRIEVYLYREPSGEEVLHLPLQKNSSNIWSTRVIKNQLEANGLAGTIYYGYRAWGPNWTYTSSWTKGSSAGFISDVDKEGNRFNPNKLLIDPYTLEISHDPVTPFQPDGTIYASGPKYRNIDSGRSAPKSIVLRDQNQTTGKKPLRPLKDEIIYEVHLRGLTRNDNTIPAEFRGTYRGAAMKAKYLSSLGVTAVEFLPIQETQNDTNDVDASSTYGDNYWGYSTLNYFAPDRRYSFDKSPGGPTREFKSMVKAFHDCGIKVYIDVVYNHTGEGYAWSPKDTLTYNIMSWRGLDNPTYYSLTDDRQYSWDNTGIGGNYNTYNPTAQRIIIDSLLYYRDRMGVDGFRFDIASVLGNTCQHGCFKYSRTDPKTALNTVARELKGMDIIAEPWGYGEGSYQLGNFPAGWSEWNGEFRDTFRRDQNKLGFSNITPFQIAQRFSGSPDLFEDDGRSPWNAINFMVVHDGFTLIDLYSYNTKNNNQIWPYGPSDGGADYNDSWNHEGVAADQRRAARNGMAFVMLSAGTPMLTGGDEYLRSLKGNNNPYNLDSSANWLSFEWNDEQKIFNTFVKRLIAFRRSHPALRPDHFYKTIDTNRNGIEQISWFKRDGTLVDPFFLNSPNEHCLSYRIDGTEFGDPSPAILVIYNGWYDTATFTLPPAGPNRHWYRKMDTSNWNELNAFAQPGEEVRIASENLYNLGGRAIALFIAK